MTRGSENHTAIGDHLRDCARCKGIDVEQIRIRQPAGQRHSVPDEVMERLCPSGRSLYRNYLAWLGEPD